MIEESSRLLRKITMAKLHLIQYLIINPILCLNSASHAIFSFKLTAFLYI